MSYLLIFHNNHKVKEVLSVLFNSEKSGIPALVNMISIINEDQKFGGQNIIS
jgi:hypothetical protein